MNKNLIKKVGIWLGSIVFALYALFLLLPFILLPLLNTLSSKVAYEIEHSTGFKTEFSKFRIVTTPKLTAGARLENAKIYQPNGDLLLEADNMQIKLSLLPLILRKIELDIISADKFNLNLIVKNDGHFLIEDLLSSDEKADGEEVSPQEPFVLPFGLKLSNHLPDFRLKEHNITFIENKTGRKYSLTGSNTNVTDFVLNKKIKLQSEGKLTLDGFEAFDYNFKILNKIMPDIDINNLLSAEQNDEDVSSAENFDFNIIDVFKLIKSNGLKASLFADMTTAGDIKNPELTGEISLNGISMISNGAALPASDLKLNFNKNAFTIDSNLNTANSENTQIAGKIKTGKSPDIDLSFKSNATLKSVFEIANAVAQIFGVNDLKTLSAKGRLDINFNIKSDLKKIVSNGYLKLSDGGINYGLYDVKIDNFISDISLDNNTVLINKLGFSTLSIPFEIEGKIKPDSDCDIKIQTSNLPLKGLLVSFGQAAILKDNPIASGNITLLVKVTEKLLSPKITGNFSLNGLNMKNIPSDVKLTLNSVSADLKSVKNGFEGTIEADNFKAVNPALTVSVLNTKASINEREIDVFDTEVFAGKNELILSGIISNYLTDKIGLNFETKGKISSVLTGDFNPYKMTLNLKYSVPNNAEIIIPTFDKSKLLAKGSVDITGSMLNPVLKGQFTVPSVEIPEVPVSISDMTVNLNGPVLVGDAAISSFESGGITAQNIKTGFLLDGNDFYLNNMQGSAFGGIFAGDIVYNIQTTKCDVKFNGKNMNALDAIEGAAGIKNALSGILSFDADLNFKGVEYNDMMKTLSGKADFEIKNGVLANLGSLKTLLNAQNIIQNSILKTAAQSASNLSVVQAASEFDYITGALTFSNAYANLAPVKLSGPSMAYYVTGKFNLLNGTTNAVILGRLSESVVGVLGNLGNLAVEKLTSLIPGLGNLTASLAKAMNESPSNLAVSEIPALRSKDTLYKDFKAEFNGGVESSSSVKSFKWLNDIDVSAAESALNPAEAVTNIQNAVSGQAEQVKSAVQNAINDVKTNQTQVKEDLNQAKEQAKDILKSLLTPPSSSASSDE